MRDRVKAADKVRKGLTGFFGVRADNIMKSFTKTIANLEDLEIVLEKEVKATRANVAKATVKYNKRKTVAQKVLTNTQDLADVTLKDIKEEREKIKKYLGGLKGLMNN